MSKRHSLYVGGISALLLGLTTGTISCLTTTLPGITQGTPFSGVTTADQLPVRLDFGGQTNSFDRYILRIPSQKMTSPVSQFVVASLPLYKGTINPQKIEVKIRGVKVALKGSSWDQRNSVIKIEVATPVPAASSVELVFDGVRNPSSGGVFYFKGEVVAPDVSTPRYIGTWIISII